MPAIEPQLVSELVVSVVIFLICILSFKSLFVFLLFVYNTFNVILGICRFSLIKIWIFLLLLLPFFLRSVAFLFLQAAMCTHKSRALNSNSKMWKGDFVSFDYRSWPFIAGHDLWLQVMTFYCRSWPFVTVDRSWPLITFLLHWPFVTGHGLSLKVKSKLGLCIHNSQSYQAYTQEYWLIIWSMAQWSR